MRQSVFTGSADKSIPSFDLTDDDSPVLFAWRTMEEIWDESSGEPDLPHRHNFYTIIWALTGEGEHVVDFTKHRITDNRIFFLAPGQAHQVTTPIRPTGFVFMFTKEFVCKYNLGEQFIKRLALFDIDAGKPYIDISEDVQNELLMPARQIVSLFNEGDSSNQPFRNDEVASWLKIFLIRCSKSSQTDNSGNTQLAEITTHLVSEFKNLLEEKFGNWHSVKSYSNEMGISPDYLNTVLKNTTGQTAKEHIKNRIVLEAKRQGINTSLSSKEIAYMLGFNDPAHFSKFYKSATGGNFTDFREESMNNY